MSDFYDQDDPEGTGEDLSWMLNDNEYTGDVSEREMKINQDFLTGFSVVRKLVINSKMPATMEHLNYTRSHFGHYLAAGFEDGGRHYNDMYLDIGSDSRLWWDEFDATA